MRHLHFFSHVWRPAFGQRSSQCALEAVRQLDSVTRVGPSSRHISVPSHLLLMCQHLWSQDSCTAVAQSWWQAIGLCVCHILLQTDAHGHGWMATCVSCAHAALCLGARPWQQAVQVYLVSEMLSFVQGCWSWTRHLQTCPDLPEGSIWFFFSPALVNDWERCDAA